ncbi:MAG TPA: hypothetical protein VLE97_06675 [Gaiellaceae bacterium]|nr:hypothetical protein [Gaiellaceae bacterium]
MKRWAVIASLAALVAAAAASAGGPPSGLPLGKPVALPTPVPGKATLEKVVFSGVVAAGHKPTLTPVGYGRPPANLRVASKETKPATKNGRTSITYYFINADVSKRSLNRASGGAEVTFIGDPAGWADVKIITSAVHRTEGCVGVKATLKFLYARVIYGNPGDQAAAMWIEGYERFGCK